MTAEQLAALMERAHRIHFIGIGGVSMSSLAQIAQGMGYAVQGSDRAPSEVTRRLEEGGIPVFYPQREENAEGADVIVYTAAISDTNPEMVRARQCGIPCVSRGMFLGWLMSASRVRVGVAGAHGKSTTTSMLSEIWMAAGVDPTIVSGAPLASLGGSYRVGKGDGFLFEACEYKDSFLSFFPTTAVLTNVEWDHPDYYPTFDRMKQSFLAYLDLASLAVVCGDDAEARAVAEKTKARVVYYGTLCPDAKYRAEEIRLCAAGASFSLVSEGKKLADISLGVTGIPNVRNALAAAAASLENGIGIDAVCEGLARFRGAERRFELRGEINGAKVYDDYAHHPSEIRATLHMAFLQGKRVLAVFQPHTYTRTHELFEDFVRAFADPKLNHLILADIYAAREVNTCGVSSAALAARIPKAEYLPTFEAIADEVRRRADPDTVVVIMGAGDIITVSDLLFPKKK